MKDDVYSIVLDNVYSAVLSHKELHEIVMLALEPIIEKLDELEARIENYE